MPGKSNHQKLTRGRAARQLASAYYRNNPRVSLIDLGWKIEDEKTTDKLAVRFHLLDKPTGARFEAMQETRPELIIEHQPKIPFPIDFIQADYQLQWNWPVMVQEETRAGVFNPLEGGISISNEWLRGYGTLGMVVCDRDTHADLLLSNYHVIAGSAYAPRGLRILQPGLGDGGSWHHTIATLERSAMVKGIDAAVAKLTSARGWINSQFELGSITGIAKPGLNMRVFKSGRGSKVTYGIVDGIEGDYPIYYGGLLRYIHHVIRIVPQPGKYEASAPGDSGSIWMEEGTRRAVALHFAGYNQPETALAISIPEVFAAMNVELPAG